MFISSSYWSDNVGLAASLATIHELRRVDSPAWFETMGEKIRAAMRGAIASAGVSATVTGWHYRCDLTFDAPDEETRAKVNTLFIQEMARRGIHTTTSLMPTLAHTDEDILQTAEAAEEVFRVIARAPEGELDELLEVETKREPFRRLVR